MAEITVTIDDADIAIVREYAQLEGKTVPDFISDALFEKVRTRGYLASLRAELDEYDSGQRIQNQVLAELRI